MPKQKRYPVKVDVLLPTELAEYLQDMVRTGAAENVSQAVRRCISLAKTYLNVKAEAKAYKEA